MISSLLAALIAVPAGMTATPPQDYPSLQFTPTRYEMDLSVDYETEMVRGRVRLTVRNGSARPGTEVPLLLHRLMSLEAVRGDDGSALDFDQSVVTWKETAKRQLTAANVLLPESVRPGDQVTIELEYAGYVTPYTEIGWLYVRDHVSEDFTILRPDALAYPTVGYPSYAANRGAGLGEFDYLVRVTVPTGLYVANGGRLVDRTTRGDRTTFVYANLKPAWRMDFAIADYGVLEGETLRVYYLPGDSAGATGVLGAAERSIAAYTEWFGPLRDMAQFSVLEIPDGWGSQADVTSVLQTAAAFNDPSRHLEVYHETAHLWHVTGKAPAPRWEEGLATYLQLLLAERLDDRSVLEKRLSDIEQRYRRTLEDDRTLATVAMADYGRDRMTGHAYRVGALMFYALHRLVGDDQFGEIVGGYRRDFADGDGSSEAFAEHANRITTVDLDIFFDYWLFGAGWAEALMRGRTVDDFIRSYGEHAKGG